MVQLHHTTECPLCKLLKESPHHALVILVSRHEGRFERFVHDVLQLGRRPIRLVEGEVEHGSPPTEDGLLGDEAVSSEVARVLVALVVVTLGRVIPRLEVVITYLGIHIVPGREVRKTLIIFIYIYRTHPLT